MWQSKREISRKCNDIIGSAKGSQISGKYWGEVGKGKRADVYLEVWKRRGHIFFEWNQCLCAHRINYISDIWGNYLEKNNFYIHSFFRYCLQLKIFLKNKYICIKFKIWTHRYLLQRFFPSYMWASEFSSHVGKHCMTASFH